MMKTYVLVLNPGMDDEQVIDGSKSIEYIQQACKEHAAAGDSVDIMVRLPDGTLTSEW